MFEFDFDDTYQKEAAVSLVLKGETYQYRDKNFKSDDAENTFKNRCPKTKSGAYFSKDYTSSTYEFESNLFELYKESGILDIINSREWNEASVTKAKEEYRPKLWTKSVTNFNVQCTSQVVERISIEDVKPSIIFKSFETSRKLASTFLTIGSLLVFLMVVAPYFAIEDGII